MSDENVTIATDEPEIEVLNDEEQGSQVSESPKSDQAAEPPKDAIEDLRASLEAERRQKEEERNARVAAEERASRIEREAGDVRSQSVDGQIHQLTSALAQLKSDGELQRRDYAEAMQSGDFIKAAEIQEKMATTAAYRVEIERGKANLEQMKRQPPRQAQPQQSQRQPPRPTGDPVEDFIATIDANSPNSKAWIRAHPQYARDENLRDDMIDAANRAVRRGFAPDTPAYFDYIEKRLGLADQPRQEPEPRRQVTPAAPVSRGNATLSSPPKHKATVRMSADEIEMARNSNPNNPEQGVKDWARNKLLAEQQRATQH